MSLACGELKTTLPFMYSKIPIIPCTVRCDLQNSNSFFKAMQKIIRRTSSVIIKPNVWERERERESGESRNFVQGVLISLWKNFESFWFISGRFSKYWLKFKIWPVWSLCLKKMFLKRKQIYVLYTKKSQKEKKEKKKKKKNKLTMWFIYH